LEYQLLWFGFLFVPRKMAVDRNNGYAGQRPYANARQNARRSRRRGQVLPAFSLVTAVIAAGAVLLLGTVVSPPRYEARSAFVVDWKSMPSTRGDENAKRARNEWRNTLITRVTGLPRSAEEMLAILDSAGDSATSQTDKTAMISKLRKSLRVDLADQTDDCDRFVIQMRANDPGLAEAEANRVRHGIVSKLKADSRIGSGAVLLQSNANVVMETGPGFLSNPGGAFLNNSIKVEETRVEKRSAGYLWGVWFAAICLGGVAGMAGQLMHPMALAVTELKAATNSVRTVKRAKAPAVNRLPVIAPKHDSQPSPLPPPLWPAPAHQVQVPVS
jgi:hypothetical protein